MSSVPAWAVPVGIELIRLGADALDGQLDTPAAAAKRLVGLGLRMVPREELIGFLTEGAVMRAEIAADIAEDAKFDPDK